MLTQADTLQTIAEISVALAGFAALAGAIGDRQDRDGTRLSFQRLRFVVLVGVLLLVLALLPLVIADYGLSPTSVWRASSAAAFVLNLVAGYATYRGFASAGLPIGDWFAYVILYPAEFIAEISIILNIFSVFSEHAGALYLTYLFVSLAQALAIFLRLLDSAFTHAAG